MPLAYHGSICICVGALKETRKKETRMKQARKKQTPAELKGHALYWPNEGPVILMPVTVES